MSGRAGRRGLDDRGIVILMLDQKMDPAVAKEMLHGQADVLNSAFHLTYNMILNLMRVEGANPEYMLENSFFQFQNNEKVPLLEDRLQELQVQCDAIKVEEEDVIADYYTIRSQIEGYRTDMRTIIHHPDHCLPFLQHGRLVNVADHEGKNFGWGIVVGVTKKQPQQKRGAPSLAQAQPYHLVDVLVLTEQGSDAVAENISPCPEGAKATASLIAVRLEALDGISSARLVLPEDLKSNQSRNQIAKRLLEVKRRFAENVQILDPIENMGIKDEAFKQLIKKIELLEKRLFGNPLSQPEHRDRLRPQYALYLEKLEKTNEIKALKKQVKQATDIMHLEELKQRKRVLRR
jgi:ATP-dependent RNA helicase DOB1